MLNNEFRKPLTQSAAILCAVVVFFTLISSSATGGTGAAILSFFSGIGNLILLVIGLTIALPLSIAILVAIFLGAVWLQSRENASQMYQDLKDNLPLILQPLKERWLCCNNDSKSRITQEEYNKMEQDISLLKENNAGLEEKITKLSSEKKSFKINLSEVAEQNSALKGELDELTQAVIKLQGSEKELSDMLTTLKNKFEKINDSELRDQIVALEKLQAETNANIGSLTERLVSLENNLKQAPTSGIFSYISSKADQNAFAEAVQAALSQDMTYSQIDEFLSKNLESALDKIIKDHPSLTKNYIRNLKRD